MDEKEELIEEICCIIIDNANEAYDVGEKLDIIYSKHESLQKVANILYERIYNQALEDNNIIYGEDAKRFIEEMNRPLSPEEKQKRKEMVERMRGYPNLITGGDYICLKSIR